MKKLSFKISKNEFALGLILIILGVLTRTYLHISANIEFITAVTLASAYLIKDKKFALIVPLASMIISDLIIGNTLIFLYTWSGFLMTFVLGYLFHSKIDSRIDFKNLTINSEILGIISTLIFFLWTNFGVVVTTTMYQHSFSGLMLSYEMALPFLIKQMVGNLIIVPLVFICSKLVLQNLKDNRLIISN